MIEANVLFSYLEYISNQCNNSSKGLVTLCIFLVTVYCVLLFQKRKYKFPPGPSGVPFLGYLPFLGQAHHETLAKLAKKYGVVFSLHLGRTRVIFINDWESVKDAMSQNATLDKPTEFFDALPSGLGFSVANGMEWFEQRRFSVKIMKDIGLGRAKWEEMLEEEVDDLLQRIQALKGQPVDGLELFSTTFTNNIMSLVFGERLPLNHDVTSYVSKMEDLTMKEIKPLVMSNFLPRFSQLLDALRLHGSQERVRKLAEYDEFMRERIRNRLRNERDNEDSFVKMYNEGMLSKLKSGMNTTLTERSLFANSEILILGGSGTTRTGLLWLLIAVAQHPEVQTRVHQELDSVLGKENTIKWADRSKVPYSFACVMEAQRWKTVTPILLMRATNQDTTIRGYKVPKGTYISVNTWALHNDPKYWPNPQKYDPSRMLLKGGKQINFKPESYNAFSYGRRNCPGEMIAMMSILAYFTKILQKFDVLPEEGSNVNYDVNMGLTYQPINFKIRFVPRN